MIGISPHIFCDSPLRLPGLARSSERSSLTLVAAMLFVFMESCIPLGFLISCFFSRARLAAIFGPFALFALILPRYIFFRRDEPK